MMEITEKILETIFKRTDQYCLAKYGSEADEITLENGYIIVNFVDYHCGDRDVVSHTITVDCLTKDLDKIYEERKEEEEKRRKERKAERIKQQKLREEREKKQRRLKYEELKKEFEEE
jgi:hypothetical protein